MATTGLAGLVLVGCSDRDDSGEEATPTRGGSGTPTSDAGWQQPPEIRSSNGVLSATLTLRGGLIDYDGRKRWAVTVNGTTPGPTLRVKPGDTLKLTLDNQLGASTNLHTHGLRVSPSGNADNPFLEIKAGDKFNYEIPIPKDHPSGMFWYHPHMHHLVASQIFGGFFGAIVVEDSLDEIPEIAATNERLLLIHDTRDGNTESAVTSATMMEMREGREGPLVMINGVEGPTLQANGSKAERWRLLNASSSRFYRLKLDDHRMHVISRDGGRLAAREEVDELVLVPGERAEVIVQPAKDGTFSLRALPISRGNMGASAGYVLATLRVNGGSGAPAALPTRLATVVDPGSLRVTNAREVVLEMTMGQGMPRFLVDGREFDANRIDIRVKLGTVEDWTVRNVGQMDHPFHLHIWPFQVLEQSERGSVPKGWKDVVNVPAGGSVKVRIPFEQTGGKTVYHCHILDHEDMGMMAVIEAT